MQGNPPSSDRDGASGAGSIRRRRSLLPGLLGPLPLAALVALSILACNGTNEPRGSSPRRPAVDTDERCSKSERASCKRPNKGSKNDDDRDDDDEGDGEDAQNGGGVQGNGKGNGNGNGNGSPDGVQPQKPEPPLAAYMVSETEIDTLLPIVQAYKPVDAAPETVASAAAFESARQYMEKALNGIMSLKALAPGRTIKAFVASDPQINAYADPWQQVVVNSGLLQQSPSAAAVMSVLCHELAHSARNHSFHVMEGLTTGQSGRLFDTYITALEDYLRQTFNPATGIYVHDSAGYARVKSVFDDYAAWKSPLDLTQEAEADAVGAMICATAGMPSEEFAAGQKAFFDSLEALTEDDDAAGQEKAIDPKDLADGDSFQVPSAQDLELFLFQAPTHPSHSERIQQMRQLTKRIAKFHDGSATQYKAWRDGYKTITRSFASFSLAEPRAIVSKQGAVIRIPPRGCSTPGHRH
jgi:Zn-dependent protease with chaperone function